MKPTVPRVAAVALAVTAAVTAAASCGTQGGASMGDVDVPLSLLGPFRTLRGEEVPFGATTLVQASGGVTQTDEPSVVTLDGLRVVFVSWVESTRRGIGRAVERRVAAPRGLTEFEFATFLMGPELPWEGDTIGSPDVFVAGPGDVTMVYAGGGAIGLATSTDGRTFARRAEPLLAPDAAQGEAAALQGPSIARAPSGEWFLMYASGGRIFAARAAAPAGPWTRVDGDPTTPARDPILAPLSAVEPDAGAAFEMQALSDPDLSITTTAAGRPQFRVFYTAAGPTPLTVVGAAASFDGACADASAAQPCYSRVGLPVYSSTNALRAGSFEPLDERTALLWVATTSAGQRVVTAAVAPATARLAAPAM